MAMPASWRYINQVFLFVLGEILVVYPLSEYDHAVQYSLAHEGNNERRLEHLQDIEGSIVTDDLLELSQRVTLEILFDMT